MAQRFLSRGLVAMLIEMKKYDSAAEVVSGAEDTFALYSKMIGDTIARAQELPAGVPFLELQRVLNEAKEDIRQHQEWQTEVLEKLPAQDDEDGLTGPLRQAFSRTTVARNKLLQAVMTAHDKYVKAQAGAFKLDC